MSACAEVRNADGLETAVELLEQGQFGLALVAAQCHLERTLRSGGERPPFARGSSPLAVGPATAALLRTDASEALRTHLELHDAFVRTAQPVSRRQAIDSIELIDALLAPAG